MSLSSWLAGRTLRARLISGLLALFLLASLGVGIATTAALSRFLVDRLDQQLDTAAAGLSFSLEHPHGPSSAGANSGSCADQGLAFGQSMCISRPLMCARFCDCPSPSPATSVSRRPCTCRALATTG